MKSVPTWLKIFLAGFVLWVAAAATCYLTNDPNLVPTVILLGSFLAPVTFAVWAFQRMTRKGPQTVLTPGLLFSAFVGAGVVGLILATVLETLLLRGRPLLFYPGVAVIEETVKLAAVWILARRLPSYTRGDGMVLGATVGFGFAAFESSGYAFSALLGETSLKLGPLLETEMVRALLTPVGHGLWTALVGGALFAAARNGRLRLSASVLGWLVVAIILHALWDLSAPLAVYVSTSLSPPVASLAQIETGRLPNPTVTQAHLDTLFDWLFLLISAAIGLILLRLQWREARHVRGLTHSDDDTISQIGSRQ